MSAATTARTSGRYTLTVKTGDPTVLDYNVDLSGPRLTRDTQHFRLHYTPVGERRG